MFEDPALLPARIKRVQTPRIAVRVLAASPLHKGEG
jgi:hypothetical protein